MRAFCAKLVPRAAGGHQPLLTDAPLTATYDEKTTALMASPPPPPPPFRPFPPAAASVSEAATAASPSSFPVAALGSHEIAASPSPQAAATVATAAAAASALPAPSSSSSPPAQSPATPPAETPSAPTSGRARVAEAAVAVFGADSIGRMLSFAGPALTARAIKTLGVGAAAETASDLGPKKMSRIVDAGLPPESTAGLAAELQSGAIGQIVADVPNETLAQFLRRQGAGWTAEVAQRMGPSEVAAVVCEAGEGMVGALVAELGVGFTGELSRAMGATTTADVARAIGPKGVAALLKGAGGPLFLGDLIVALGPEKFVGERLVPALGGQWCSRVIEAVGTGAIAAAVRRAGATAAARIVRGCGGEIIGRGLLVRGLGSGSSAELVLDLGVGFNALVVASLLAMAPLDFGEVIASLLPDGFLFALGGEVMARAVERAAAGGGGCGGGSVARGVAVGVGGSV
jgi:hypothetical protein